MIMKTAVLKVCAKSRETLIKAEYHLNSINWILTRLQFIFPAIETFPVRDFNST